MAPEIDVSGVLSSWLMIETNSSLRCSCSFCSVTSRSTTTTPCSVPDPSATGVMVDCTVRSKSCSSSRSTWAPPYSHPRTSSKG